MGGKESLPGMPPYDPNKIVHGEQSLEIITPFPVEGGQFNLRKTCIGVYDKGSGMVIETALDLFDEQDKVHYCRMISSTFVRGYGGWNVRKKKRKEKNTNIHILGTERTQGYFISSSSASTGCGRDFC